MRFAFILAEKAWWPVVVMCAVLKVSTSGFYAWLRHVPSKRARKDERLKVRIGESFTRSRRTYGSPRVHVDLADERVGRNRIIRIMQSEGHVARVRRRYRSTTMSDHDQPIAANLLNREFEADAPNQRWVGDTTELLTSSGKFYLAVIVDLYARFVVGWAVSAVNDRHLTIAALDQALPAVSWGGTAPPFRPGQHLHERGLPESASRPRHHVQHEPTRKLLRQRRDGELVLDLQGRARGDLRIHPPRQGPGVRLHRGVLQPAPPPQDLWQQVGGQPTTRRARSSPCACRHDRFTSSKSARVENTRDSPRRSAGASTNGPLPTSYATDPLPKPSRRP